MSAVGELQKRLAQPPPSIRTILPDIPQALDQLITQCTEPDAAKRFQTTAELVAAIELLDDNGKLPARQADDPPAAMRSRRRSCCWRSPVYIWWASASVPSRHEHVSVLIADFKNTHRRCRASTARSEQTLRRALRRRQLHQRLRPRRESAQLGVPLARALDEARRARLAVKQGLGVVLSGSIEPAGNGYRDRGEGVADGHRRGDHRATASVAPSKDRVLETATTPDGARPQRARRRDVRIAAAVCDAQRVDEFAGRARVITRRRWRRSPRQVRGGASRAIQQAVELDPKFGLGYQGLAAMSRNLGQTAGRDEVHQGGAPLPRRDDGAREVRDARLLLPDHWRQSAVREGIRRVARPISRRQRRPQPTRGVPAPSCDRCARR